MHKAMNTVEQGAVRFSFSHYNTEEEIDTAIKAVKEIALSYETKNKSDNMREKQQRLIVTFKTTTGAMAMEKACKNAQYT